MVFGSILQRFHSLHRITVARRNQIQKNVIQTAQIDCSSCNKHTQTLLIQEYVYPPCPKEASIDHYVKDDVIPEVGPDRNNSTNALQINNSTQSSYGGGGGGGGCCAKKKKRSRAPEYEFNVQTASDEPIFSIPNEPINNDPDPTPNQNSDSYQRNSVKFENMLDAPNLAAKMRLYLCREARRMNLSEPDGYILAPCGYHLLDRPNEIPGLQKYWDNQCLICSYNILFDLENGIRLINRMMCLNCARLPLKEVTGSFFHTQYNNDYHVALELVSFGPKAQECLQFCVEQLRLKGNFVFRNPNTIYTHDFQ